MLKPMKNSKFILSFTIILISLFLSQQIIRDSIYNQNTKRDYAELNDVKYGLLSVNKWKQQISIILSDEINKLSLTNTNQEELKKHIEVQLNTLIDKINAKIKASNKGSAKGWVKQTFMDLFISLEDIKKGIPEYADAILHGMTKAKTQLEIKEVLKKKLTEYLNQTFDTQDTSQLKKILLKNNSSNIESARVKIKKEISHYENSLANYAILLILLSFALFGLSGFSKEKLSPARYCLLVTSLLILLITGVTTPMIDMEAKISQMSFVLLDHTIQFDNQVLYFQTKSVLDVFWIMITDKTLPMKLVGMLMITFSILFPLAKLMSSMVYFYNYRDLKEKSWVQFFVFKSGKWSMADVLVVAIFMAYIGFNGIINSQIGNLNSGEQNLVLLTTNGTSLQPGFYIFLTYALLALGLSGFLAKENKR